jgi:pimeloyl-ACP methyl ester carboxylesterase
MERDENDLSIFDHPHVLQIMFYPRRDPPGSPLASNTSVHFIEVEGGISIGCRLHWVKADCPNILYFHGNGEIASDYDGISPHYNRRRINLFVADYRGYGMSGGHPTATSMIRDALHYQGEVKGLIVESGFADALGLLSRFGVSIKGVRQETGSFNLKKIQSICIPTLIIHSQYDHIIPLDEGIQLHKTSGAKEKDLLIIPNANHNDLMMVGMDQYFEAIEKFVFANRIPS